MKELLAKVEASEPAPAVKISDSELWPVVATVAVYLGLALLLAWFGPGVPSERYFGGGTMTDGNPKGLSDGSGLTPKDMGVKP
jgi:hypothetical protein